MAKYCEIEDVQAILPAEHTIGTNLSDSNVNVLEADVDKWITFASSIIDSELSTIYRIPLIPYKQPDFTVDPITFEEIYPDPIPLICARLVAASIYDEIMMSQQSPNVSDWGKNQRSLAYDSLRDIRSGLVKLRNQPIINYRFVRGTLYDDPRASRKGEFTPTQRQAGT